MSVECEFGGCLLSVNKTIYDVIELGMSRDVTYFT